MKTVSVQISRENVILAEVAKSYYGDPDLDVFLYDINKQLLLASNIRSYTEFLPVGIMLSIPIDYPEYPRTKSGSEIVQSGETLKEFAKRVYGCECFGDIILKANGLTRSGGFLFRSGDSFFVPALADAQKVAKANRLAKEFGSYWR